MMLSYLLDIMSLKVGDLVLVFVIIFNGLFIAAILTEMFNRHKKNRKDEEMLEREIKNACRRYDDANRI